MGKLASTWKTAKDTAEKAVKTAQKKGDKADMPKFKSDFQNNLDTLEAAAESVDKLKQKLEEEQRKLASQAVKCRSIIGEYASAIKTNESSFTGPTTRAAVHDGLASALRTLTTEIDKLSKA